MEWAAWLSEFSLAAYSYEVIIVTSYVKINYETAYTTHDTFCWVLYISHYNITSYTCIYIN